MPQAEDGTDLASLTGRGRSDRGGLKGAREIRTRIADLVGNLEHGSPGPAAEALFELLGRGPAGLAALAEWAAHPGAHLKLLELLAAYPARAVTVYGAARRRIREFLDPLLEEVSPGAVIAGIWESLAAQPQPPQPVAELAARASERLETRAAEGKGEDELRSAQALLGVIRARSGDLQGAVAALAPFCDCPVDRASCGGLDLPRLLVSARELLGAAGALGDGPAAAGAVRLLLGLGQAVEAAESMAGLLSSWPADPEGRARLGACLRWILCRPGVDSAVWLNEVWSALLRGVASARRSRRGYFAKELGELESVVGEIAGRLRNKDNAAWALGDAQVRTMCALASSRVAELIGELVVYQPLRAEQVNPRQIALEVVVSTREQLAAGGIELRVGPNGESPAADPDSGPQGSPVTDSALVKSVLRQVLLRLGRAARRCGAFQDRPGGQAPLSVTIRPWVVNAVGAPGPGESATGRSPETLLAGFSLTAGARAVAAAESSKTGRVRRADSMRDELIALVRDSTVADALTRAHGRMRLTASTGPGSFTLVLTFPSLPTRPAAGPGVLFSRLPGELTADPTSPEGAEALAVFLLEGLAAAVDREVTAWGEELGIVLHDLKNSLAFVAGWLRGGDLYDSQTIRQRSLESIEDVQFWLVEAGAMLARPEGAPGPYTDVVAAVRRVLRGLAAVAAQRGVRVDADLPDTPAMVPAESFRVASVVRNLAKNGLEATPPGETLAVEVAAGRPPGTVSIVVRDSGPGFLPEALSGGDARQIGNGLSRPRLGLLSARRILQESGGRLLLANERGGVATARFPAGGGAERLARSIEGWRRLPDDVQRALRAAAAMSAAGNTEMARHLWRKALEVQTECLRRAYRRHEFLPRATELLSGKGKGRLSGEGRAALASAYGPGELPRAEQRARTLLSAVIQDRLRPHDLGLDDTALLVALQGAGPGAVPGLAASLTTASRLLADPEKNGAEVEEGVLRALESLASFAPGGPGD